MARIECDEYQLRIGQLQNQVDFGLALGDRPGMRVERELHAVLERTFANLVEVGSQNPGVFTGEVVGTETPAEVGLQRFDAEI